MLIAAYTPSLAIPLVVVRAMVGVGGADGLGATRKGNSQPRIEEPRLGRRRW